MRQNQNNNQQERKRNRQNESAGEMANDLKKTNTPLNPNHDYAHDVELGTYADSRERYDNLINDTVLNRNTFPNQSTEFANELDECQQNEPRREGANKTPSSKPASSKNNKK